MLTLIKKGKPGRKGKATSCEVPSNSPAHENVGIGRTSSGGDYDTENYKEGRFDLAKYLIKHPSTTFYVWVEGDSNDR